MIEVVYASLTASPDKDEQRPLQPFTQELMDLHRQVLVDWHPRSIAYKTSGQLTRKVHHASLRNVVLEAGIELPLWGTMAYDTYFRLSVVDQADEMSLTLPLSTLNKIDIHDDPFSVMMADYFRSHVQPPSDQAILLA